MTKKRSRAASAKKTVRAARKPAAKAAAKKTVARRTTKKAAPAVSRATSAKAVAGSRKPAARTSQQVAADASSSNSRRGTTVKRTVAEAPPTSWLSAFAASPWANPQHGAASPAPTKAARPSGADSGSAKSTQKTTAKTSAAAPVKKTKTAAAAPIERSVSTRAPAEPAAPAQNLGELLTASPWANRLRTGAASAAAAGTRTAHARRPVGDKATAPAGFTDLMAASPWATKLTPAFQRRSPPESAAVSRVASPAVTPRPLSTASPVAAAPTSAPREPEERRGASPVPMVAQDASVAPPPMRRAPPAAAPPPPAAETARPERPSFAPRQTPVSRPAREVQRDELGEAIRELAGAVAESQFVVKKPGSGGISDADRLKTRLAERQRSVSRAAEEPSPRFRPKQRAPIPKRPVEGGMADVAGPPRAAVFDPGSAAPPAGRTQATVAERAATASAFSPAGEAQKKKLEKTIPIEGLGRGVFNALGNGVGRIFHVGKQSVTGIALGAKDGARLVSGFFREKKPTTTRSDIDN